MLPQVEELRDRTKQFAIRIVNMVRQLPRTEKARIRGRQLLRSATSVAANYRAACRSRSRSEFAARIGVVVEEADESVFWIELLAETGVLPPARLENVLKEANELLLIFSASQRTARTAANRADLRHSQ